VTNHDRAKVFNSLRGTLPLVIRPMRRPAILLRFRHRSGRLPRGGLAVLLALVAILSNPVSSGAGTLSGAYTNPTYLTSIPFGAHSHWLQPWRAYLETTPASTFVNGVGMNFDIQSPTNPDLVMHMLANHGVRHPRIEIGWGNFTYQDETQLFPYLQQSYAATIAAARTYGMRPLILLNAHHGAPGPALTYNHIAPAGAPQGATTITVDSTTNIIPGYSGLNNLTTYWMAEALVTSVSGTTLTLSKPLPNAIAPGAAVSMSTLKYRPFSVPGSADYLATMAGWNRYVKSVATFVANGLGTAGAADKGFDFEVWNELTFGSNFLYITTYYNPNPYNYNTTAIFADLPLQTSNAMEANPGPFTGVQMGDGMANTIPWPSSSQEPKRITAIDKHPYGARHTYPQEPPPGGQNAINALGTVDAPGSFVPSYSALFPEYYGTALQTETMVRDMGPITNSIYGTQHGRYARYINGQVAPVSSWITEVNQGPVEDNPNISTSDALALKAKSTARYLAFFLNKGVTQLDFYGADGGDKDLGMVLDSFIASAGQPGATYPADDRSVTSPALATMQRMVAQMSSQMDPSLTLASTRPLAVTSITDTHDHYQFAGDGTAAHPPLYDRDVFSILPFQVNSSRFVIPYYVQTRDYTKTLAPEQFTVQLQGIHGANASVAAYDPVTDTSVPVTVTGQTANSLTVQLSATDSPRFLTVQEGSSNNGQAFPNTSPVPMENPGPTSQTAVPLPNTAVPIPNTGSAVAQTGITAPAPLLLIGVAMLGMSCRRSRRRWLGKGRIRPG